MVCPKLILNKQPKMYAVFEIDGHIRKPTKLHGRIRPVFSLMSILCVCFMDRPTNNAATNLS